MSNDLVLQELNEVKNLLKVANAKIQAANQTLGALMGENNELKAFNILMQQREQELCQQNGKLNDVILDLEKKLNDLTDSKKDENADGA